MVCTQHLTNQWMQYDKPYEVKEQRHQVSVLLLTQLRKQVHGLPQVEPKVDFIWFLSCVMWSTALYKKLFQTIIFLHWLLLLLLWARLVFGLVDGLLWKKKIVRISQKVLQAIKWWKTLFPLCFTTSINQNRNLEDWSVSQKVLQDLQGNQ